MAGFFWSDNFNPEDFKVYRPSEFFRDFKSDHFPEMQNLNPKHSEQISRLFNFLQNNGIPIGIGTNANNHTIFELYLPLISRPDGLPGSTVGVTEESQVGNLYLIDHDAFHHLIGIPGPRLSDLDDPVAAHKKLFSIMLLKEQAATTHSLMAYVREYWNWRDKERSGRERKDFREFNRGIFSMGNLNSAQYVEMFGHFVHGRSIEDSKFFLFFFAAARTEKARLAGVPLGGPDTYPLTGVKLESWLFKMTFPIIEPLYARYREVGYKGFEAYSEAMTNFMLQPWYVEWADRFQFGIPLDELMQRSLDHLEGLRTGKLLGDTEAVSNQEFDRRFLVHEIALFGRRIAELREMGRRGQSKSDFSYSDDQKLSSLFESSAQLHDQLKKISELQLSETSLEFHRMKLNQVIEAADLMFPIEVWLPQEYREPFLNYSRYWRDMTGVLVPRYGHNSGALSTTELKNFISARRLASKSFHDRQKWKFREWFESTQFGKPEFWRIENEMADDYERNQAREPAVEFRTEFNRDENVYQERLEDLSRAIEIQIDSVLVPQISEVRGLSSSYRANLFQVLNDSKMIVGAALSSLRVAYEYTFINPEPSKSSARIFGAQEHRFNVLVDKLYEILFDLSLSIQKQESSRKLLKFVAKLKTMNAEFRDLRSPFEVSTLKDIKAILPNRSFRWTVFLDSLWTLSRKSSDSLIDSLHKVIQPFRFIRTNALTPTRISGWNPAEAPEGPAHYVLALNHDQGLLEIPLAYSVFESLGVERVYTLTTKKAFGRFPAGRIPGENVVYIEDDKPLDEIVRRILKSEKSRVGILICPEGALPSMAASTPLAAKAGGFVLARKLARALAGKIPVYLLNGIFNGHEHFTSEVPVPLELVLQDPMEVPTSEISRNDEWVKEARLKFENLVNIHRVIHQPDLINPRIASATNFPVSDALRPYVPISRWFNGKVFSSCSNAVRKLHGLKPL